MSNTHSQACVKILERHRIDTTSVRVSLLAVILQQPNGLFSINDIRKDVEKNQLGVSETSIVTTLKLFSVRGIIRPASIKMKRTDQDSKVGRPESMFILLEKE